MTHLWDTFELEPELAIETEGQSLAHPTGEFGTMLLPFSAYIIGSDGTHSTQYFPYSHL